MSGTTDNYSLPYPTGEDTVDVATDIQSLAEAVDTLVQQSLAKYLPLAGGTMTGTITNARSGGSWISGKSGALFADFTTPCSETGSRYDPYVRGCDTAGNYWNFGAGADGKICTVGYLAATTSNKTDWRTYQDIETGIIGCSGTAAIYAGYLTSSATGGGTTGLSVGDANTPVYFTGGRPAACTSLNLSTTGNAATATKFASAQSIALTGDVTGSASSTAGWSVATTLASSGVTAGSYGPSANVSPSAGGTFSVPYVTVDAKGRLTAASTKTITLPATATKFASAQSVTLTGDVTGSASSTAGWSVATTLASSGVTAGSYGPSANVSPSAGGTFSVPYVTVDAKGRVTAASTKTITLPATGTYTLPVATTSTLGGVKASTATTSAGGVNVTSAGVMSVPVATTSAVGTVMVPATSTTDYDDINYKGPITLSNDNYLYCPVATGSTPGSVRPYVTRGTSITNGQLYVALPFISEYCSSSQTFTKSAANLTWSEVDSSYMYRNGTSSFYTYVSGYYLVNACVGFTSVTSGDSVHLAFYGGSTEMFNINNRPGGTSGNVSFSQVFYLDAGTFYCVKAYNATGARGTVVSGSTGGTRFSVVYIGE